MKNLPMIKKRSEEIPGVLNAFRNGILKGYINPLEMKIVLSALENWIKYNKADNELNDCIFKEAEKYNGKPFEYNGRKFHVAEMGVKWDFTPCEDKRLESLYSQRLEIDEKIKEIENELKSRKDVINFDTGEILELKKPIKTSTTVLKIFK